MKRKSRLALTALAAILVSGLLATYFSLSRPAKPEPFCRGKPLSYWLPVIERGDNPWVEALLNGTVTNGADAIPILLRASEMRGGVVQSAYRALWPKMPGWVQKRWPRPVDAAKVREYAASLLGRVGDSDFHISLLKTHPEPKVRAAAAMKLGLDAFNDKATAALAEALPKEQNPRAQAAIAEGLCVTGHNALIAVPALIEGLGNKNPTVRQMVAEMLTGTSIDPWSITNVTVAYDDSPREKHAALQELLGALKDKDTNVHSAAARWLWFIDKQAAANAGLK